MTHRRWFSPRTSRSDESKPRTRQVDILGKHIAVLDHQSAGAPVLFLQYGIGSMAMWRRIVPALGDGIRPIAFDLPGSGASEKTQAARPNLSNGVVRSDVLARHVETVDLLLELLGIDEPVSLVVHGLGSMVGFAWGAKHPERVRSIVHMESVIRPLRWPDIPETIEAALRRARSHQGREYAVDTLDLVTDLMPALTEVPLEASVAAMYRAELSHQEDRWSLWEAILAVPIEGAPVAEHRLVAGYHEWLRAAECPKLLIKGEPGLFHQGSFGKEAEQLPNQQVVHVLGRHLLTEDSPNGVATFVRASLKSV